MEFSSFDEYDRYMRRVAILEAVIYLHAASNSLDPHSYQEPGHCYYHADEALKAFINVEFNELQRHHIRSKMEMDWSCWGDNHSEAARNMLQEMEDIASFRDFTPRFGEDVMKDLFNDLEQPDLPYATYCMKQYGDLGIRNDVMTDINNAIDYGVDMEIDRVY